MKLSFRVNKKAGLHILESQLSENQTCIEHEDCYEISATAMDSLQLKFWINGFGKDAWDIDYQPVDEEITV